MKRFGYFVRLGGDAEIAEALARGAVGEMKPAPTTSSEAVRRVAMWQHTPEEWREMTLKARRKYRRNRRPEGMAKALLIGYALVCMAVKTGFRALFRAVERGGAPC